MGSPIQNLDVFVRDALAKGAKREEIGEALARAGWPADQANAALNAYADVSFTVPVPRPRPTLSAHDVFLYLLLFTTLYLLAAYHLAYHLGSLLFHLINRA